MDATRKQPWSLAVQGDENAPENWFHLTVVGDILHIASETGIARVHVSAARSLSTVITQAIEVVEKGDAE